MQLVVVGTGLMGGSFALAARRHQLFHRVVGVDPDGERRQRALELGVVDAVADDVPSDADAVLLAGPSHTIAAWVGRLAEHPGVVFDTGSVKAPVLEEIAAHLGAIPARFVPCHPLTGSERSGPAAADADLYQDAPVIVTPHPASDPQAVTRVEGWWRSVGARLVTMGAAEHDGVLARTSHLPHLLAFAYLRTISGDHLPHTAGGFRDFTRIGGADARVWAPILQMNREAVTAALDDVELELQSARRLLNADDPKGLLEFIEAAAARRRGLPDAR